MLLECFQLCAAGLLSVLSRWETYRKTTADVWKSVVTFLTYTGVSCLWMHCLIYHPLLGWMLTCLTDNHPEGFNCAIFGSSQHLHSASVYETCELFGFMFHLCFSSFKRVDSEGHFSCDVSSKIVYVLSLILSSNISKPLAVSCWNITQAI